MTADGARLCAPTPQFALHERPHRVHALARIARQHHGGTYSEHHRITDAIRKGWL
jgi:hypothetical protein